MERMVFDLYEETPGFEYPNGLLKGSEFSGITSRGETIKLFHSDKYRRMNLLALCLSIVVDSIDGGFDDNEKKKWHSLVVAECAKIIQYRKNLSEFNRKHHPQNYSPDIGNEDWYCKRVYQWFKQALFDVPDWDELMVLAKCHIVWLKEDRTVIWWEGVVGALLHYSYTVDFRGKPVALWNRPKRRQNQRRYDWVWNLIRRMCRVWL